MSHLFPRTVIAACILTGSAGLANAAVTGSVNSRMTDVQFTDDSTVTTTLTPTQGMQAGYYDHGFVVAHVVINADSGNPSQFVIRWTPGSGMPDGNNMVYLRVTGKNPENHIRLRLDPTVVYTSGDWILCEPPLNLATNAAIDIITSHGQTINADTYSISVDTAIWNK